MWKHGPALACALSMLAGMMRPMAAAHFDCTSPDDVKGEIQDASGYLCANRCAPDTFNCPMDVPVGTSAQPQCMLQDVDRSSFCGLLCQVDSQCPNGAQCRQIKQVGLQVGICLYPVSFTDWASTSSRKKFTVGWPTRAGASVGSGTSSSFQIARTYAALQSLKSKYSIDDGDADMLALKELLSAMTSSTAVSATPVVGGAPVVSAAQVAGPPGDAPAQAQKGAIFGVWSRDVGNFENYVADGVPGIERELHDTVWNVEHIYHRHAAENLMRGTILIFLAYLGIGSFFKYQSGARGMDMIPHIGFWAEYPALVNDGVTYSKILLGIKTDGSGDLLSGGIRSSGSGAFEAL